MIKIMHRLQIHRNIESSFVIKSNNVGIVHEIANLANKKLKFKLIK